MIIQLILRLHPAGDNASRKRWVPAVNNHGGFGCWAFAEVSDPWDAEGVIRAAIVRVDGRQDGEAGETE